jgi:hypothetical protein
MLGCEPLDFAQAEFGARVEVPKQAVIGIAKSLRHEVYKHIDKQLEAGDLSAML